MKNRGIVKIDEVGRLVIPKDVRNMLALNDKLVRVYVDDDRLIIKKYAPLSLYKELLSVIADELALSTGCVCIIGDAQKITEVSGQSFNFIKGKHISDDFKKKIREERNLLLNVKNGYDAIKIVEGVDFEYSAICLVSIKDEFSHLGFFALIATDLQELTERELNLLKIAKQLFLTVIKSEKQR